MQTVDFNIEELELSKSERLILKAIKNHFKDEYPLNAKDWTASMIPFFEKIYGLNPNDKNFSFDEYYSVLFNLLLNLFFKVYEDGSGSNQSLKKVFAASFAKSHVRDDEKPIKRAISELCGHLQSVKVYDRLDGKMIQL